MDKNVTIRDRNSLTEARSAKVENKASVTKRCMYQGAHTVARDLGLIQITRAVKFGLPTA